MASTTAIPSVKDAERRAWSYWFIDGLPNLVVGVVILFAAAGIATVEGNSHLAATVGLIALAAYLVFLLRLKQIVEWLKSRITYPRTGYVATPDTKNNTGMPISLATLGLQTSEHAPLTMESERWNQSQMWLMWLTWLVAGATGGAILLIHSSWSYLAAGMIIGVGLWLGARKVDRMAWIGTLGFPIAGACLYVLPIQRNMQLSVFLAIPGFLLVIQGAIMLACYLRRNPGVRA